MDDKVDQLSAENQALGTHVNELTQAKIALHTLVIRLENKCKQLMADLEKALGVNASTPNAPAEPTTPTDPAAPVEPTEPTATPAS